MPQDDKRRDYTPGQGEQHQDVEHQGGGSKTGGRKEQSGQGSHSGRQEQGGRQGNRGDRKVE